MEKFIECKNLWKWFPSPDGRLEVLKGLDFALQPGGFVAVVGASGVGKSTFLHMLGLIDSPSDGELIFQGTPFSKLTPTATAQLRARTIGFVFQFHHLLPEFTALENLLIAAMIAGTNGGAAQKNAMSLLDELGLADRKDHFPSQLSGGEQQRVALARALMNNPQLVIADEPTGNLDSANAQKFMEIAMAMRQKTNCALVLATHNPQIARYADVVLRLSNGVLGPENL